MNRDQKSTEAKSEQFDIRLRRIVAEFGSRNALAKATGIPASTLQGYEAGAKPGMDALVRLARVGNVDLNWLVTGRGEIRPSGLISGAAFADIVMVNQYELGTALSMSVVIGQFPYSRYLLEKKLNLTSPTYDSLFVVQAGWDLYDISRGDLVLVDGDQKHLSRDGIYLFDLPGIALRAVSKTTDGKVRVEGPEDEGLQNTQRSRGSTRGPRKRHALVREVPIITLLGNDRIASKVVGRAVWISRGI
jgi:transcriptional regulator with XRE-family HTH domain